MDFENIPQKKLEQPIQKVVDENISREELEKRLEKINGICEELGVEPEDKENMMEQIKNESRFAHVFVKDKDGQEYFLKILVGGEEAEKSIAREIIVHQAIENTGEIKVSGLKKSGIDPENGKTYLLQEILPKQKEVGFIQSEKDMEKLTGANAKEYIEQLVSMHEEGKGNEVIKAIKQDLQIKNDEELYEVLQDIFDSYDGYEENTLKIMSMFDQKQKEVWNEEMPDDEKYENYVTPQDFDEIKASMQDKYPEFFENEFKTAGARIAEREARGEKREHGLLPLWLVLEYRLGANDFRKSVQQLVEKYKDVIENTKFQREDEKFLVHGDSCPRNTYYQDNGKVQMIDWGHAGFTKNKLLALIYDFGNMRARAWNNTEYREAMGEEIINYFRKEGSEEAGKAVVALGILRSHCCLAGFFENYDIEKQKLEQENVRRENTEADIKSAFTLAGIEL